jgi:peptidoglycan/xylan/chitin deacetylase (PgdA/CDA1 family)
MNTLPEQRWHPSTFIRASALLHAGAIAAMALNPDAWTWGLGAIAADQALLTLAGMMPRSDWLGPNWRRLPCDAGARGELAISLDDGPDPLVTPAVLDLLDRWGAKASFFCIAERALRHPELVGEIIRRGHAVENHTLRHRCDFSLLGPAGLFKDLSAAQEILAAMAGTRPRFFRAPAGLRNPFLDPVLTRLDLRLASWTRRGFDTCNGNADLVCARLLQGLSGGDILLLHDGNAARTDNGNAVILEVLPRLLNAISIAGLRPVTLQSVLA